MRLLVVDPETPMSSLCDQGLDTRPINAAFHALFTYTLICRALTKVLEANVLSERQTHETLGRLGLILVKSEYDLRILALPDAYTPAGWRCYEEFGTECRHFRARYGALVGGVSYDNQPYVFNYARFVERNGGPWPVLRGLAS